MKLAKKVLLVFALIVIIGGLYGMISKESVASLIAGVISGALLLYSRWLWGEKNLAGLIVGLVVSIALLGRFAGAELSRPDGPETWPGGVVIFFSVVTIVVLIAAFLQEKKSASGSQEAQPAEEAVDDGEEAGQAESGQAEAEEAQEEGVAEPEETEEAESSDDA